MVFVAHKGRVTNTFSLNAVSALTISDRSLLGSISETEMQMLLGGLIGSIDHADTAPSGEGCIMLLLQALFTTSGTPGMLKCGRDQMNVLKK